MPVPVGPSPPRRTLEDKTPGGARRSGLQQTVPSTANFASVLKERKELRGALCSQQSPRALSG